MNTELLRTFLEIAKTRHFGKAAENLYLTQSAVSFRIRQLEETIGVKLFMRQRNNILLTPSGERLVAHAENILASWQLALQDIGVCEARHFQLTLGGTSNLWDTYLQSMLPKLAAGFPGLYMRTEINTSQDLVRALLGGRLDIAVILDPPKISDLNAVKIGNIELVLCTNKAASQLHNIPEIGHIFVDWGTAFNLQQAKLFHDPVAPVLHTAQSHIALEFLLSNGGAAFLPKSLIEPYLADDRLFLIPQIDSINRDVYAVHSRDSDRVEELTPIIEMMAAL